MPPRRWQKLLIILRPRDYSLPTVCWLEHDVYETLPIMPKSASDITKKIYKSARRWCASTPRPFATVGLVLSVVLLDVVLLQCGSQGLSSKFMVSSLTFNHILHDKTRLTTAQTPLISISTSPSMAPATRIRSRTIDDTVKVRAAAHVAAATHPRSPDSAPLTQRANEDLGQHEQLPASSDEAQM